MAIEMADEQRLPEPRMGEMPIPGYIDWKGEKRVAIRTYSSNQELGDFIWWANQSFREGLRNERIREVVALYLTTLRLQCKAELAIGPPITWKSGGGEEISLIELEGCYGFYVESDKRDRFMFSQADDLLPANSLREIYPNFDQILAETKRVMPLG